MSVSCQLRDVDGASYSLVVIGAGAWVALGYVPAAGRCTDPECVAHGVGNLDMEPGGLPSSNASDAVCAGAPDPTSRLVSTLSVTVKR